MTLRFALSLCLLCACSPDDASEDPDPRPVRVEPPVVAAVCGNGAVEDGEVCDDRNRDGYDYCSADCSTETGSCGDGEMQPNEVCDWMIPEHQAACDPSCKAKVGFACLGTPRRCEPVSLAGLPSATTSIHELDPAQQSRLCGWVQQQWQQHLPASGYRFCGGSSFDTLYTVNIARDTCATLLGLTPIDSIAFQRVLSRCALSVSQYELCMLQLIVDPCKSSNLDEGITTACFEQHCTLRPVGAACSSAAECKPQYCCPSASSSARSCADRCESGAPGAACTTDAYCKWQRCLKNGVCADSAGLYYGAFCREDDECASRVCNHTMCDVRDAGV